MEQVIVGVERAAGHVSEMDILTGNKSLLSIKMSPPLKCGSGQLLVVLT
jgi:hypothetical protein